MATVTIGATDWLALKSRVDQVVTDPVMQRFDPGEIVTPPANLAPFILLSDARFDTDRMGIDPRLHRRSGLLSLAVQIPIARRDWDHERVIQLGGTIASYFRADQCMNYGASRLRVTRDADVMQPYVQDAYRVVLVRVPWSNM